MFLIGLFWQVSQKPEGNNALLWKLPNCGIASKICIEATPTNVYNLTYSFLHVYNSNFEQPIRSLVTITIKCRLAVKIRIVNMQKNVGAVVDVCGSGGDTNFWCDSTVRWLS
jgi:hypothetical protein